MPQPRGTGLPEIPFIQEAAREFQVLNAEEQQKLEELKLEFWRSHDTDRRAEILNQIERDLYSKEAAAFAQEILRSDDEALRIRAVNLLAGNISPAILSILGQALNDPSEQVRLSAVAASRQVRDEAVVDFLSQVFANSNSEVRLSGLTALDAQPANRKLKILRHALKAADGTVQLGAVDLLQMQSTPKSVEVLFDALDSSNATVQHESRFSLDFLLDQEFRSADEARAWWQNHRAEFDEDLARIR